LIVALLYIARAMEGIKKDGVLTWKMIE